MTVVSNTFGGLFLTDEDAEKFRRQVRRGRPTNAARQAAKRGRVIASQLASAGQAKVDLIKK